jgi:glycosyltransferase involved in cell wall biosynthesis
MARRARRRAVLPAYNAGRRSSAPTRTPQGLVDDVILVDDCSAHRTVEIARQLGLHVVVHEQNRATAAARRPAIARPSSAARTSS